MSHIDDHLVPGRLTSILTNIFMPTSVHIPKPLLVAVDRKARALKISRNRLIVQALERDVKQGSDWSPDFFGRLASVEPQVKEAAEEMLKSIQDRRRSKNPTRL
jgi:metal-responsive CopG/Arc/MetJ family transcriptional regulator